jgi:PAS domain S-box-containing protein
MIQSFKTFKNIHIRILVIFILTALIEILFALFFPLSLQLSGVIIRIILLSTVFIAALFYQGIPLKRIIRECSKDNPELTDNLKNSHNIIDKLTIFLNFINKQKQLLANDLAHHKNIEISLRKSEQRYRNLIETLPDATILTDCKGSVILVNHRSTAVLGVENDEELLNSDIYSFIPQQEHDQFSNILNQLKKKNQIEPFECLMMKKNIPLFFNAEVSMSATYGQDDQICELIFLIRDISERKRTEVENAKMEEQFRSIYKMEVIGQLAGGIAHDFNNILGAISGYGDIILLRYQEDDRLMKYANMILSAAGRASDLTKKLLTFSRKSKILMESINVHKVIEETAELLQRTIDKNIQVTCSLNASKPFIIGDAAQIQSAIMNLAINSRDAMPVGGEIQITTENTVLDEKLTIFHAYSISPGSYLAISIHDTGSGMDHHVLSHLFEPFFTTKDVGKGTGLGLASVYGTIKSHNGYIDVKSKPGKGSSFTMYIPDLAIHSVPEISLTTHTRNGKGTILVVDDETVIRDAVKEMLAWLGYSVFTCSNGMEAIEFYKNRSPVIDLVILDMIMPGMNGKECLTALKNFDNNVKVILSTGYRIEEERQELLNNGIINILQKPFVSAQLAQAVHFALNR